MQSFDASSIVYAWDNYPPEIFPPLWDWMAEQVSTKQLTMSVVAFDETINVSPDCATWLKDHDIQKLEVNNTILQESMRIKALLGIVNDKFGDGVGENDIFIIATAMVHRIDLVSDERRQKDLPKMMTRYKIPAVCNLPTVRVNCYNYLDYIKNSGAVFK